MADSLAGEKGAIHGSSSFFRQDIVSKAFAFGATLFFTAAAAGLTYSFVYVIRIGVPTDHIRGDLQVELIQRLAVPSLCIFTSLLCALFGYLLLRGAGTLTKDVIPERDRKLLQHLIANEKDKGIDQYIRLSSLIGASGVFTRMGLVGLPFTTVALTLFFTIVALSLSGINVPLSEKILDLAKLTLGAFIGSYVQRQANEAQKPLPNTGQSFASIYGPPYGLPPSTPPSSSGYSGDYPDPYEKAAPNISSDATGSAPPLAGADTGKHEAQDYTTPS